MPCDDVLRCNRTFSYFYIITVNTSFNITFLLFNTYSLFKFSYYIIYFEMSTTPKVIADLLTGIDRFNPEHLSKLEQYVSQQVSDGTYDKEANLTVLKLSV